MAKACLRCGGCCVVADITMSEVTATNEKDQKDFAHWLVAHRCDVTFQKRKNGKRYLVLRIPTTCVHLDHDGEFYFCKIYKTRPNLCKVFKCLKNKSVKKKKC